MERNLRRIKNHSFPASPTSGDEIIEIFSSEDMINSFGKTKHESPTLFYKGTICNKSYTCTFFASDHIISLIGENIERNRRKYLMDATFKIVPVGCFSQILIIYVPDGYVSDNEAEVFEECPPPVVRVNQTNLNIDDMLCVVCKDSKANVVYFPCRDMKCCQQCSSLIAARHEGAFPCPNCRQPVIDTVVVFV